MDDKHIESAATEGEVELASGDEELPVVARLVVEIRSDGSRTVARGAMEDALSGEKVAIEARGSTPLSLAMGLAKTMMRGRSFAKSAVRAFLPSRKKR